MSGQTSFFEHFDHASWDFHFFLHTLDDHCHRVEIIFKSATMAIFGMRHRMADVCGNWKLKRKTFHNLWIVPLSLGEGKWK